VARDSALMSQNIFEIVPKMSCFAELSLSYFQQPENMIFSGYCSLFSDSRPLARQAIAHEAVGNIV
jgi:hypothetical protein